MRRARLPEKFYRQMLARTFRTIRFMNRNLKVQSDHIQRITSDLAAMGLTPQMLRGSRDECARAILGENPPQKLLREFLH